MSPSLTTQPIIPAWKRLGLKLKSAQQFTDTVEVPVVVAPVVSKPKSNNKKRKAVVQESPHVKKIKTPAKVHEPLSDIAPITPLNTPDSKRRKSVTFTPETKIEDGDSIKQLYNGWVARNRVEGHKPGTHHSKPAFETTEPSSAEEQFHIAVDTVLKEVEEAKTPKKEKKAEKSRSQKIAKTAKPLHPSLLYLKHFHESKDTWKFNKIHQIHLLKNIFDIDKVPSECIELLYAYVAGLKGGARTHLRDAAFAIKVKDREEAEARSAENMEEIVKEQDFEVALKENVASMAALGPPSKDEFEADVLENIPDITIKKRMAKRMRAERILDELAHEAGTSSDSSTTGKETVKEEAEGGDNQKRVKLNDGSTQRLKRKRKQRTNAVDDSSSDSSESETSSDDDEDDDDAEDIPPVTEEESSSSSSSSSSNSESEVDDDENDSSESGSDSSESE